MRGRRAGGAAGPAALLVPGSRRGAAPDSVPPHGPRAHDLGRRPAVSRRGRPPPPVVRRRAGAYARTPPLAAGPAGVPAEPGPPAGDGGAAVLPGAGRARLPRLLHVAAPAPPLGARL